MKLRIVCSLIFLSLTASPVQSGVLTDRAACIIHNLRNSASKDKDAYESPIQRAPFKERVVSKLGTTVLSVVGDVRSVPWGLRIAKTDRREALEALERHRIKSAESPRPEHLNFPDVFPPGKPTHWKVNELLVGKYGSSNIQKTPTQVTINELKNHFLHKLPKNFGQIAADTVDALNNPEQIEKWLRQIEADMITEMQKDGLSITIASKEPALAEYYLDRILARHAQKNGFNVNQDGMPSNLVTYDPIAFFPGLLGRKRVFVDWTGAELLSHDGAAHSARGHLLQMAYASDHVPHFADLMKYVGRTVDRDGVWSMLFDNAYSLDSPFWTGRWVSTFQRFLGIRY